MLTLQNHALRLSLAPNLGAGITDFSLRGPDGDFHPLMRRAAPSESNASSLASFIMAPWANRIRAGRFSFEGRRYTIKTNNADVPEGMAQHGDVRKRPWSITQTALNSAVLEFDSADFADINWPWPFSCRAIYQLLPLTDSTRIPTPESRLPIRGGVGGVLSIHLILRNTSPDPVPAACGHHPYFMRRLWNPADELHLSVPAAARYPLKDGCAAGPPHEDDLTRRLRTGGENGERGGASGSPIPNQHIDAVFAAPCLTDPSAPNAAILTWPASKVTLRITASSNMTHWVLFAPHEMPEGPPSPRPYIAVEPQTQVNDALNLAASPAPHTIPLAQTGTIILPPGEELITHCEFEVIAAL